MMIKLLKELRKSRAGATAVEYGLIAALVSIAIVGALSAVGTQLTDTYTTIGDDLSQAAASTGG